MVKLNITLQDFVDELIEEGKIELKKGEKKLTDEHIERITESLRSTFEEEM